jgi:hypothetical protein
MSLRNRARSLQKKTGLTYQQALDRLRALGERPAKLHRESGWPLDVCDRFLVDGHAPIDVVELKPIPSLRERIVQICEELRVTAAARAVLLSRDGHILAHVGVAVVPGESWLALMTVRPRARVEARRTPEIMELDDDLVLLSTELRPRAVLVVKFHRGESSLGLVRLRVRRAIEELEPLLAEHTAGLPPLGGGAGGLGGLPNELRVVEPVPEERPRKKPTPIGRKRKR